MNVLYVTGQLWDADFLEHELHKIAPNIHLDVAPRLEDALARISVAGRYDVLLLDSALPTDESQSLIAQVREQGLPITVVALVPATGEDPPLAMLEAGADDYLVKRPNFTKSLPACRCSMPET
jgi:DNA-binding response OmpR family regulator